MSIYEHTAGDRTPFTYVIFCKPTNQYYYGVRYAKGCHPSQLWTTYFTSSSTIKKLRDQHGDQAFSVTIRKVFNDAKAAVEWETKVLKRLRVVESTTWLNQGDNTNFRGNGMMTDEIRKKLSERAKGRPSARKGQQCSKEHRAKIAEANKGRVRSQSVQEKAKRSQAAKDKSFGDTCKGLIWVNDGVTSKRIKPEDFASSGLARGRLVKRVRIAESLQLPS